MASGCAEEKRDNLEGRLVHRSPLKEKKRQFKHLFNKYINKKRNIPKVK
jgi:hypothetical protein